MDKSTPTYVVNFDKNFMAVFRKKDDYIVYSIHLRSFNGIRMFGTGPAIFSRIINTDSIVKAVFSRERETKIEFYVPEGQDTSNTIDKTKSINIGNRHIITVTYEADVDGMNDTSIEIEVHEEGQEVMRYQFTYFDNKILGSVTFENGDIITTSFEHNKEEVFSIS
jgi:hypothetical protein